MFVPTSGSLVISRPGTFCYRCSHDGASFSLSLLVFRQMSSSLTFSHHPLKFLPFNFYLLNWLIFLPSHLLSVTMLLIYLPALLCFFFLIAFPLECKQQIGSEFVCSTSVSQCLEWCLAYRNFSVIIS